MKNKGFTLSELLIVVAIIAVVALISIPVFASQLERSRESADIDNIRAAKSAAMAQYLEGVDLDNNAISSRGFTCYFDASSGILTKEIPKGYGQGTESDAGCEDTSLVINPKGDIAQSYYIGKMGVEDKYITVFINSEGTIKISWDGINNSSNETGSVQSSNESEESSSIEEEASSSSFVIPEGALPFHMTLENRDKIGFTKVSFTPESIYEIDGQTYYLDSFEDNSLNSCSNVITIPDSLTHISDNAFKSTNSLTGFVVNKNKNFSVINNKLLTNGDVSRIIKATNNHGDIVFPSTVKEVAPWAFKGCSTLLRNVTMNSSIEKLGEGAFYGCTYLRKLTIPGSVKSIPASLIYNSSNQVTVTLEEGVERIEEGAICAKGLTISLPNSIKYIANNGFKLLNRSTAFSCTYKGKTYTTIASVLEAVNS